MSTGIQWTDETWNPFRGCSRVSSGCDNCYAMRQAHRFAGPGLPYEGLTTIRRGRVDWSGGARFQPSMAAQPLKWRKPRRVFVNSMSDLFHPSIHNFDIAAVFAVMAAAQRHTFQILTKRPERAKEWFAWLDEESRGPCGDIDVLNTLRSSFAENVGNGSANSSERWHDKICNATENERVPWPLPNVWLGTSVEDQATADARVWPLLQTPATVRWVSAEPLLGPVSLAPCAGPELGGQPSQLNALAFDGLDWVVVGGESGPSARRCKAEWLQSVVHQCKRQQRPVPVFVKQVGSCFFDGDQPFKTTHRKGGDPEEWPSSLRIRETPGVAL